MPAGSSSALALAARLRALDDDALAALVTRRELRSAGIRDWFDLAEALLDRSSVQRMLERLDRPTLAVIASAAELASSRGSAPTATQLAERLASDSPAEIARTAAVAVDAGLLGEESGRYAAWDAVVDQLTAWPSFDLPALEDLLWSTAPPALGLVDELPAAAQQRAGETGFATISAITDLVLELRREPARRLAKGGIALPDARRLAATAATDPETLLTLVDMAERAGLIAPGSSSWTATDAGEDWLDLSSLDRWSTLASAWLSRLPDDVRRVLTDRAHARWGDGLLDYLEWLYPAGGEWMRSRVDSAVTEAEQLGLVAGSPPTVAPSAVGVALLESGVEAASAAMASRFPDEVEQVYLQHDLSVISPGPLAARLDARLRSMAEPENRGLASTYRITAASITRGLMLGETAETMREFLTQLSLTGMPQPLEYLLRDTADRFGSLRVGVVDQQDAAPTLPGARSYVRSEDPTLIGQVVVDPALGVLGLERAGELRALSRIDATVVYWNLVDARYPAVAEDAEGGILHLRRTPAAPPRQQPRDDPARTLIARLRGDGPVEPEASGTAWIARQLELAAKVKTVVAVMVRMPDGSEQELRLEPASVAGGRLRARDARADLERTLPLSSITSVTPLT